MLLQHGSELMVPINPNQFDSIRQIADPMIAKLQSQENGQFTESDRKVISQFSFERLKAYAEWRGYRTNTTGALFRTDLAGAFRGDHRTPHELAINKEILAFSDGHTHASTTGLTLCASTLYQDAAKYAKNLSGENQLKYNSQYDTSPIPSPESGDADRVSDDERPIRRRARQTEGFVYLIDTQGLEVVPLADNVVLNPVDSMAGGVVISSEVHISVPEKNGIPSHRIWLVNSTGTEAVKIDDLYQYFPWELSFLENDTLAGSSSDRYDRLFDLAREKKITVLNISEMTRKDAKQTVRYATNLLDDRVTSPAIPQSNKLAVSGANYSANTRFDSQLILQLEDDLAVVIAAEKLTSKHPDRSVQFKFDSEGRLHLVYGNVNVLSGKLRWQVVGHGSGGENEINHQTLGGYSPTKLAEKIKQLSTILYSTYQVNSTPHYVSLVGCSLTDYDLQTGGYAYQFGIALDKQGIRADIAARRTQMAVNELGHKITLSDDGFLYHKISENKLVLTWNIQGQLVSASDLTMRLVRAITLVDQLSSGEVKYSALDVQQRRDLADSFHRAEGILDVEKLILTAFEHRYYQAWRNDMHQLLQLQDSYAQLRGMTGQTARQYSNYWSACQSNSIVSWRRAGMENRTQGVEIDIRIAPQGLFIGDSSTYAFVTATGMGMAWLNARAAGESQTQNFLNAIVTHAMINEQKAEGALPDADVKQLHEFGQQFGKLKSINILNQAIFTPVQQIEISNEGEYLLKAGNHVLMLSSRYQGRQHRYALYDSYVGEISVTGSDATKNGDTLNATLQTYLAEPYHPQSSQTRGEYYGMLFQEGQYGFEATYQVNIAEARKYYPTLEVFQASLKDFKSERQRLAEASNITLNGATLPARTLSRMGATLAGKPVSAKQLADATLISTLQFNPEQLCRYLTQANKIIVTQAVQFLKHQFTDLENVEHLLVASADPSATLIAAQLLNEINQQVDGDQINPELWSTLEKVPRRWQHVTRLSQHLSNGMQGYGYLRGLRDLKHYSDLLNNNSLPQQQKSDLEFEKQLAIASFSSNIAIDAIQYSLDKLGNYLVKVAVPGSRIGQIGVLAGLKLAKFGGPLLGGLSSGFDIYHAYRSFSALGSTPHRKARQDLIVSGSLAMAGAAISIGTAIAFALGGTAATVAGPMGLILGGGLLLSGGIYSAVREIEDIQQYVYLTSMETLINGWRIFTGQGISPEIENQAAANKVVVAARQEYDRLHAEHTQKILMSNSQIDVLYTSRGEIELQEHYYRKIVVKDRAGKEHLVRDYITPNENVQTMLPLEMAEFRKRWLLPIEFQAPSVVPSEYAYYTAKLLTNTDDSVIAHDNFSWQVIPTYFTGQRQPVGQFVDQQKKPISVDLTLHPKAHHRVMGDFNGDGWQDIGYFLHSSLYLLLANKKGGYYDSQQINYASEGDPILSHHQVGDINSDGLDDIVLISDQHIDILFAQANGDFIRQPVKVKDQGQLKAPALSCAPPLLADINGDGYVDWVSFIHGDINVNYGSPAGEFNSGISVSLSRLHQYSASEYLYHLAGDINGDGCDDIVSMTKAGRLHTLLGNHENWFDGEPFKKGSQLSYTALTALLTDFNPAQLQLNDIDNDGCADLVVIQDDGSYALSYGGSDNKLGSVVDDTRKLEKGKVMNYRSNRLAVRGKHCILGIIPGLDGKPALLSLNQDGEVNAHTVGTTPVSETIADFRLGGGNDVVIGHQNQKNSFEIGEGSKTFTGGWYADRFLLMGHSAPSRPSILDGGDSLSLLKDNDDNDTIIAAVKPLVGGGYIIDLDTGIVSYTLDEKKTIAILRHIEHAQGHRETNDILQGNDEKNLLNGVGGKDSLYGEGGNDILILQAGIAHGGEGTDSYRILQNDLADNVMVTLYEAPNRQEVSNILLDHTAEQIISISQKEGFILITLRNDNGTRTILGLSDMYRSLTDMAFTDNPLTDTQAILQHNYLLYTRDGLMITGWPKYLALDPDGSEQLNSTLTAQYKPEWDRDWQKLIQGARPEEVQISLTNQSRRGKVNITIEGREVRTTVLPPFIRLMVAETPFSDRLEGDNENNQLLSTQGNDILIGKAGADHYVIAPSDKGRHITINNHDDSTSLEQLAQDTLVLPLLIKDIRLSKKKNDIVLSHRDAPALHPIVRIVNFMQDVRYRHIALQDGNDTRLPLVLDKAGNPSLGQVKVTSDDDIITLYHESMLSNELIDNQLNLLQGDDIFIDLTRNTGGYALSGGKGNDTLVGSIGDDTYLYARGDGHDSISERGGCDSLKFTFSDISKETLWLEKQEDDLIVLINGANSGDTVTIKHYYSEPESKIETIVASGFQLAGNNIETMVEAMSTFSAANNYYPEVAFSLLLSHVNLQTQIDTLWVAVPSYATVVHHD